MQLAAGQARSQLYLVLLVALRDVGVSNADVNWAEVLAVFRSLGWPPPSRSLPVGQGWWRRC